MKVCTVCKTEQPLDNFYDRPRGKHGKKAACKSCSYDYQSRYRYNGFSTAEKEAMLVSQGEECALCGSNKPGRKQGWCTDHDHETGKVRGILCHNCNTGLGKLGDTLPSIYKVVDYLRGWK